MYQAALEGCEAPTWRERNALVLLAVGRLPTVRERVALWRELLDDAAEADVVYRAILVRVQTAADLKELHDALGLRSVDADLLAKTLARAKTPAARLAMLRETALKGSTKRGPTISKALRCACSTATTTSATTAGVAHGRVASGIAPTRPRTSSRAWVSTTSGSPTARPVPPPTTTPTRRVARSARSSSSRRRIPSPAVASAISSVHTAGTPRRSASTRRSPQLTAGRRERAARLALAAQGMGRIEEAVSWAEKASGTGAPDGSSGLSKAARATASAFLAWAESEALRQGRKDDADKLHARAKRVGVADAPTSRGAFASS